MPYPPPPGPPGDSIFQGIGLLPEEGVPDPTGHSGEFLGTDGIIPEWEPVTGVLPDQTGHAGQFLTTDGASPSWADVPSGFAVFDLGRFGATAGTIGDPSTWTSDIAQSWYDALAALTPGNQSYYLISVPGVPKITAGPGAWVSSMPLCAAVALEVEGSGSTQTVFSAGKGVTGGFVPGFAGPLFYISTPWTPSQLPSSCFPTYGTHLVGSTGQSLVLAEAPAMGGTSVVLPLHDSWPWGVWLGSYYSTTALTLRFWVRVDNTAPFGQIGQQLAIIGSRGPKQFWADHADVALAVDAMCVDGVNVFLRAFLTTDDGGSWAVTNPFEPPPRGVQHVLDSNPITPGSVYNVEVCYDGSNVWLYVNGVHQAHTAASGAVIRAPNEGVTIGAGGPEDIPASGQASYEIPPITGLIDSIELSDVARHTGTGSFSVPTQKYTADAHTLALYNWDQAVPTVQPKHADGSNNGPLLTLPFVVGQCVIPTDRLLSPNGASRTTALVPHYMRVSGASLSSVNYYHDLQVDAGLNGSCMVALGSNQTRWRNVVLQNGAQFGLRCSDSVSFFVNAEDVAAIGCAGIGFQIFGEINRFVTVGCGIGTQVVSSGTLHSGNDQPTWSTWASFFLGPGFSPASTLDVSNCSNDEEVWPFTRQIAGGAVVWGSGFGLATFRNNLWFGPPTSAPTLLYNGIPGVNFSGSSGRVTHINDYFQAVSNTTSGAIAENLKFSAGNILLINCLVGKSVAPAAPDSNKVGWISRLEATSFGNLQSVSTTETTGHNLAGTFTIESGFTTGGPVFANAEPDTNYILDITPKSFEGTTPAVGSRRIISYTPAQDGFTAECETDPGGTSIVTFSWQLTRISGPPLIFDFMPSNPSTYDNPLAGAQGIDWAVGVSIVPGTGHCFVVDATPSLAQTIVEAGTTIGGADYWEIFIEQQGAFIRHDLGTSAIEIFDAFVSTRGELCSILSPGTHNIVIGNSGGVALFAIDGVRGILNGSSPAFTGAQPAQIHLGERFDASQPFTAGSFRNFKFDTDIAKVFSSESGSGPGAQAQGAFFGNAWTMGYYDSSGAGGYASQIANTKYGTTYYYMAAGQFISITDGFYGPTVKGMMTVYWVPWGSIRPALTAICIMGGWDEILGGVQATDIMDVLNIWMDGAAATATWRPPTAPPLYPWTNAGGQAWAEYVVITSGSDTIHIGGFPLTYSFTTDNLTTATNLANAINADVNISPLVTAVAQNLGSNTGFQYNVFITANAIGAAGNGIPVLTSSSFWYTGPFGGGVTFGGQDTTVTIEGITLNANFNTDANTTVNDLIARIAGNGTLNPLVTGSLVSGQMLLTANAVGNVGNSITVSSNGLNITAPAWHDSLNAQVQTLGGGINGAVTPNAVGTIVLCNVWPMGTAAGYSAPKEAQRVALNAAIAALVSGSGGAITLGDVDTLLRDPGNHSNLDPTYDTGVGFLNSAAHTALATYLGGLLP